MHRLIAVVSLLFAATCTARADLFDYVKKPDLPDTESKLPKPK